MLTANLQKQKGFLIYDMENISLGRMTRAANMVILFCSGETKVQKK